VDILTLQLTTYFLLAVVLITAVLNLIQYLHGKKLKNELDTLETAKNKVINAPIMSELSKVESLVKNEKIEEKFKSWQKRFNNIKNVSVPHINDLLLEADFLLEQKKYDDILSKIADIEIKLYESRTKTHRLLKEIQEITLSEEKNRSIITNMKINYRELLQKFINDKEDYGYVTNSVELQFENIEKRFQEFEHAMDDNDYDEVSHIVKALDDMIKHMQVVIEEVPSIVLTTENLVPRKIQDVYDMYNKMKNEGYQLDYLNVEYNVEEINKKISSIKDKLKVLNLEEILFELKTFLEYLDSVFNDFEREKITRRFFEEAVIVFKARVIRLNDLMNELYNQIDETKYNYDISEQDLGSLDNLNNELKILNNDFKSLYDTIRTRSFPYSKLNKELEILTSRLSKIEERLNDIVQSIGNMKDDEKRAREQLNDINDLLKRAKYKIREYKMPIIPNNYFVELKEAQAAIREIVKELEKKPINIDVLNTRVDTARDLAFKLYNTSNEMIKTVMMAEMAIIYGNRYRSSKIQIEEGLTRSELYFIKGDYKRSLEITINAIEIVEPGIYRRLLSLYDKEQ
jgi:septation ring formation regulator